MKLLFVCTHNRCRSILAEAIARHLGGGRIDVASAGSSPAGEVHPLTLKHLARHGIPTRGLASKSWDEAPGPAPDVVVTVCDRAAGEACPLWLGNAEKVHWGLADPSAVTGDEAVQREAFDAIITTLQARLGELIAMPDALANPATCAARMRELA